MIKYRPAETWACREEAKPAEPVKALSLKMRFKFGRTVLNVQYTRCVSVADEWMTTHFAIGKPVGPDVGEKDRAAASAAEGGSSCSSSSDEGCSTTKTIAPSARSAPVMGIDLEWRPVETLDASARHSAGRPALLQLSTADGNVLLLHVCHMHELPRGVAAALASWAVLKVGVGIQEDARKLTALFKTAVHGCLDLGYAARTHCKFRTGVSRPPGFSLAKLASHYLRAEDWKSKELTLSNWEAEELSQGQMCYAALDAWVAVAMFPIMALPVEVVNVCLFSSLDAPRPHYITKQ
jgi:hypothetical protein